MKEFYNYIWSADLLATWTNVFHLSTHPTCAHLGNTNSMYETTRLLRQEALVRPHKQACSLASHCQRRCTNTAPVSMKRRGQMRKMTVFFLTHDMAATTALRLITCRCRMAHGLCSVRGHELEKFWAQRAKVQFREKNASKRV